MLSKYLLVFIYNVNKYLLSLDHTKQTVYLPFTFHFLFLLPFQIKKQPEFLFTAFPIPVQLMSLVNQMILEAFPALIFCDSNIRFYLLS